MNTEIAVASSFLDPGHVHFPSRATQLCAVAGFGVVVTLFDRIRRRGGMCHYLFPYRQNQAQSTALYAGPAIVALTRMLLDSGSESKNIEANLFGGAWHPRFGHTMDLSRQNIRVGLEILEKLGIELACQDVGGERGRKIVFNSDTGETAVLRVNRVRNSDWSLDPSDARS